MTIDWVKLGEILPAAVLAIIFAVFAIILLMLMARYLKQLQDAQDARQERQDKKDSARDEKFIAALADRDREWRDYMGADRVRQVEALTNLAKEVERTAALVSINNTLIVKHDEWERGHYEAAKLRRTGDTGPLGETK
jgi:flagellar biosynthesis/type III secretory pathway M-ring protein FliF/YscJ